MKQLKTKILENKKIGQDFCRMRIESGYLARNSVPGQFFEVKCSDGDDPLLRRPLGCHRILDNGVEMLYELAGRGTEILSKRRPGELLDIIGPLGKGFDISGARSAIIVAGGIGVAPLLALAEVLVYSVERIAYREKKKTRVIIGAKTKNHILCMDDFKKLGCPISVSTEDGSKGHKGLATELLNRLLRNTMNDERYTIYACGPNGMLKNVALIAKAHDIPCQVSLEEHMACGVGVCLGCPVKVRGITINDKRKTINEYKMVCKDGPVFSAEEIVW